MFWTCCCSSASAACFFYSSSFSLHVLMCASCVGARIIQIFNTHCSSLWCCVCTFCFILVCAVSWCPAFPLNQSLARCERVIWLDGCIPMGSEENETKKNLQQHYQPTGCWLFQQFLFYSFTSAFTFDRFFSSISRSLTHAQCHKRDNSSSEQRWKNYQYTKISFSRASLYNICWLFM